MDDLKKPRVAAEFVLIANESTTKIPFKVSERKTIDDEHTPGIFKLMDIISPDGVNGTRGNRGTSFFIEIDLQIHYRKCLAIFR